MGISNENRISRRSRRWQPAVSNGEFWLFCCLGHRSLDLHISSNQHVPIRRPSSSIPRSARLVKVEMVGVITTVSRARCSIYAKIPNHGGNLFALQHDDGLCEQSPDCSLSEGRHYNRMAGFPRHPIHLAQILCRGHVLLHHNPVALLELCAYLAVFDHANHAFLLYYIRTSIYSTMAQNILGQIFWKQGCR